MKRVRLHSFSSMSAFEEMPLKNSTCHISYQELCDVKCVVHASDGFFYDAFALYDWLTKYDKYFVIPGMEITFIEYRNLFAVGVERLFFNLKTQMVSLLYSAFLKNSHVVEHDHNHADAACQTDAIKSVQTRKLKKKPCIPGRHSAFVPYTRPYSRIS